MDTIKISGGKPKMIAHRGLSGIEPENSLAAFIAAGNRSYFGIETDVHRTLDGEFIITHDDQTGRVSNTDLLIESSTFAQIRNIDLKDNDGKPTTFKIPTLQEYIKICRKYCKIAVLELKNRFCAEDIRRIVDIIDGMNYLGQVIFISFNAENLKILRGLCPDQPLQFLTERVDEEIMDMLKQYRMAIDLYFEVLNKELADHLHRENIEINVWTCDDKTNAERMIQYGVDYITTNILE